MTKNRQNKKIALLLHVARKQAIEVYNTFAFSQEEEGVYDSVIAKFDAYCNPKKNETYERYVVNSRKQLAGKSVEHFVTDLKLKAQTCQFDVLRDRIILGVSSQRVRERLLREDDLNLEKAIKVCQAAEATEKHISALTGPGRDTSREVSVNYCATTTRSKRNKYLNLRPGTRKCGSCDTYGKNCNKCGKSGHYARVCRSSSQASKPCHYVSRDEYE